ncbi:MAG: hypothetical protein U1U88_002340 [Lawsonella clevelandensis]
MGTLIESDIRHGVAPTEPLTLAEKSASAEIMRELTRGVAAPLIERAQSHLTELATAQQYEQAAFLRDTTAKAVLALGSLHRYQQLYHQEEIIVAEPDGRSGWFFTAIRHGMFAGTLHSLAGENYQAAISQLHASAQTILSFADAPMTSSQEERQLVYRYLGSGHVRLVEVAYPWHEKTLLRLRLPRMGRTCRSCEKVDMSIPSMARSRCTSPSPLQANPHLAAYLNEPSPTRMGHMLLR